MRVLVLLSLLAFCLAGLAAAQPVIATGGIQNGGSYATHIAQGSIFVIKGTGLCPPGVVQVKSYPVPKDLNGVSITFTPVGGGAAVQAYMVYTYNKDGIVQLAGLLPSDTPTGDYDVTVSYNGTSAPLKVTVVERTFGIVTVNSAGDGPAQATDPAYALNRFTTGKSGTSNIKPAHPGETVILWGTGVGADLQSDATGGTSGDQTAAAGVTVAVGDKGITPGYAGRSSQNAGTDQINVKLPPDVQTGCTVPVQVRTSASRVSTSNIVTIAIAKTGSSVCASSALTKEQLTRLDNGETLVYGTWRLDSATNVSTSGTTTFHSATGEFAQITATKIGTLTASAEFTSIGSCTVIKNVGTLGDFTGGAVANDLDAGNVVISVPAGADVPMTKSGGFTYHTSSSSGGFTVAPGSYTFKGSGGAGVNAFNAPVTIPALFVWSNVAATTQVSIGQPLPITWSGGDPAANVIITAISGACTANCAPAAGVPPSYDASVMACVAKVSDGSFTVPGTITGQLYATTTAPGGVGYLSVLTAPATPDSFAATLSPAGASVDRAITTYTMGTSINVPFTSGLSK